MGEIEDKEGWGSEDPLPRQIELKNKPDVENEHGSEQETEPKSKPQEQGGGTRLTFREISSLNIHHGRINVIKVVRTEEDVFIYSASSDCKVYRWKISSSGDEFALVDKEFSKSGGSIFGLDVSVDNRMMVYGGADKCCRFYDLDDFSARVGSVHTNDISCLAISNDGRMIASGGYDGCICLWNIEGRLIKQLGKETLNMHKGFIKAISFVPGNCNILISGGFDGELKIWDLGKCAVIKSYYQGNDTKENKECDEEVHESVDIISVTPDGGIVAYGGKGSCLYLIELGKMTVLKKIEAKGDITAICFALNHPMMIFATKQEICVWSVSNGITLHSIKSDELGNKVFCTSLAWHDMSIITGLTNGRILIYEMNYVN